VGVAGRRGSATPPTGTYRLQLRPGFGFAEVEARVPYLASLGISHLYLSPVLQAAPGSEHGYDVVDHDRVSEELGGEEALRSLSRTVHGRGVGLVVDVVPNHMAVPVPAWHNRALWSVLRDGPASPYATWFDIDWEVADHALLMPVLGEPIDLVLDGGELSVGTHDGAPVVRYHDHVFPVRPGTEGLPLEKLLEEQWYRLAWWRVADEELNYRRFFDVDSLAGLRVERDEVFTATHRLTLGLIEEGVIDGLRVDHPDGLTSPEDYLDRLTGAARGTWIVVEKILQRGERLPGRWRCDGTTGYDTLDVVSGLFIDPAGWTALSSAYASRTGASPEFATVAEQAKRDVLASVLRTEVEHLVDLAVQVCTEELRLRDHSRAALRDAITELLVAIDRYRVYVRPDSSSPETHATRLLMEAAALARERLPDHRGRTVDLVADLALARRGRSTVLDELCTRFQQTAAAAMAKGIEDTALYRWVPLAGANEVGGRPADPACSPTDAHAFAAQLQRDWPATMTTLSTHDSKRGEDTRARLAVLSEVPEAWGETVEELHRLTAPHRAAGAPDRLDEELLWQTLVGLWPWKPGDRPEPERVAAYLMKALREAKRHSSWADRDVTYEATTERFVHRVLDDPEVVDRIERFVERIARPARANVLGQKLVQLLHPGVPDLYQGAEREWLAVVDPDNRRPHDFAGAAAALDRLDGGAAPVGLDDEKQLLAATALRLRRERPGWFDADAGYEPLVVTSDHLFGFVRAGRVAVVVSRLVAASPALRDATFSLPPGRWSSLLAPGLDPIETDGRPVAVGSRFHHWPVALLVAEPSH
jgi:(1->4)-alpha-D-glucan 1-alpha-D-glucosylmutase